MLCSLKSPSDKPAPISFGSAESSPHIFWHDITQANILQWCIFSIYRRLHSSVLSTQGGSCLFPCLVCKMIISKVLICLELGPFLLQNQMIFTSSRWANLQVVVILSVIVEVYQDCYLSCLISAYFHEVENVLDQSGIHGI